MFTSASPWQRPLTSPAASVLARARSLGRSGTCASVWVCKRGGEAGVARTTLSNSSAPGAQAPARRGGAVAAPQPGSGAASPRLALPRTCSRSSRSSSRPKARTLSCARACGGASASTRRQSSPYMLAGCEPTSRAHYVGVLRLWAGGLALCPPNSDLLTRCPTRALRAGLVLCRSCFCGSGTAGGAAEAGTLSRRSPLSAPRAHRPAPAAAACATQPAWLHHHLQGTASALPVKFDTQAVATPGGLL